MDCIQNLYHNSSIAIMGDSGIINNDIFKPQKTKNCLLFQNIISSISNHIQNDTDKKCEVKIDYNNDCISLRFQLLPADLKTIETTYSYGTMISYKIDFSMRKYFESLFIQYDYLNDAITMSFCDAKVINTVFKDNKYDYSFSFEKNKCKILIFDNQTVYHWLPNKNGCIPLRLTQIQYLFDCKLSMANIFFLELLQSLKDVNPLYQDVIKDLKNGNTACPIAINDISLSKCTTKKLLFSNFYHLDFELPNAINKMSFKEAYVKIKAAKHIKDNNRQLMYSLKFDELPVLGKNIILNTFRQYYIQKGILEEKNSSSKNFVAFPSFEERQYILDDYIAMALKVNKVVDLHINSFSNLLKKHDDLIPSYEAKQKGRVKIPHDSPFYKLKLPSEFEKITTKIRLFEETKYNSNCVISYITKINEGSCVIYSILFENKRYTIEIQYSKKRGYYCEQCSGYKNKAAPNSLLKKIGDILKKINT